MNRLRVGLLHPRACGPVLKGPCCTGMPMAPGSGPESLLRIPFLAGGNGFEQSRKLPEATCWGRHWFLPVKGPVHRPGDHGPATLSPALVPWQVPFLL